MSEEQCKMLRDLQVADFNVTDWNLYMHTHPGDMNGCQQLHEAQEYAKKLRKLYESLYGPLTLLTPKSCEKTSCTPWPWQV